MGIPVSSEFYLAGYDENQEHKILVIGIRASHPSLPTRRSFRLGGDRFEIIEKLEGMYINHLPDCHMDGKPGKE